MVRRAAAGKLGEFAETMDLEHLQADLIPLFLQLAKDEQVRRQPAPSYRVTRAHAQRPIRRPNVRQRRSPGHPRRRQLILP